MCVNASGVATFKLRRTGHTYMLWDRPILVLEGDVWGDSLKPMGDTVSPSIHNLDEISVEFYKKAHLRASCIMAV